MFQPRPLQNVDSASSQARALSVAESWCACYWAEGLTDWHFVELKKYALSFLPAESTKTAGLSPNHGLVVSKAKCSPLSERLQFKTLYPVTGL